jgi:hypothetical protein
MSDPYWNIGYRYDRVNLPKSGPLEKVESDSWVPRAACEWSPEIQNEVTAFFVKCDYPFRLITQIPFKDPLRSEIRRFFISLDAYIETSRTAIPYKTILYGAADIKFSEYLKRVKRKSFETSWNVEHFDYPEWWNNVPAYQIYDIGDIFNYSYLIFWKEDSDDYKYGWEPLNENKESIAKFKDYVKEILPERKTFDLIDKLEIISNLSSSIAVERHTLKSKPHYILKNRYLELSKTRHPVKRTVIPVSPNNIRDTVLNDPGDLNTISLIDHQLMEILRVMPGHIHLTDKERVTRRLNSLYKKCHLFLQRDLKKEGITKPRSLLKAMLEALHEAYPDIEVFGYTSFFDDFKIEVNSKLLSPIRGHGLGMANSLTTLMQLAVHQWIIDELSNDISDIYSKVLCINDDFTVGFRCREHLDAYWDKEDEVMSEISLLREPTKSFASERYFVLAERYFTPYGEYEKVSYQLRELLYPLACYNITHAKEYFTAAQIFCDSKYVGRYIGEITTYWGYEFFPYEFNYPSIYGGWVNERLNGVDLSLLILEKLPYNDLVYRGFEASKTKLITRGKGALQRPPIFSLLAIMDIPDEFHDHFNFLPSNLLNRKFGRILSLSTDLFKRYWDKLLLKRKRIFNQKASFPFEDIILDTIQYYKTYQFYPCDIMIQKYHMSDRFRINISDPYIDPNPKLACLSKFNLINYPFKETFSIRFTNPDASTKKTSSLFSKEIQRALKSDITSVLITGKYHEIYYPKGDYRPQEQYLNPIKIGEITALLNWGKGYPEIKKIYEHPLINEKREIFNYLFSLQELELITRLKLSRPIIKQMIGLLRPNQTFEQLVHEIEEIYQMYPDEFKEEEEDISVFLEEVDEDMTEQAHALHLTFDNPYGDNLQTETQTLSMRDFLVKEYSYRVWNAINNHNMTIDYVEPICRMHLFYTDNLTCQISRKFGGTPQTAKNLLDEYRSVAGPISTLILKSIGLMDNLMDFINETDQDQDLELGDLFGFG